MIASHACAWIASWSLAAGVVVDVGGSSEARASWLADEELGTLGLYGVVARPFVQGALESERVALEARYQPQLSLLVPTERLATLLHTANAGAELVLTSRLRLRMRVFGNAGELDPGSARRELFNSIGLLDQTRALSYAAGGAEIGLAARLTRVISLDVSASARGAGSPGLVAGETSTLRTTHNEELATRTAFEVTRLDAAFLDAALRANTIVDGGTSGDARALGVLGAIGYRRMLLRGAALELRVGGLASVADLGDGRGRKLALLPLADSRVGASLDLGGGAAFFGDGAVGITPVSDPFGSLLESRAQVQLGVGARLSRETALRGSVFFGAPFFSYGPAPVASSAGGASATFSWAFVPDASLDVGGISQARLLPREPAKPRVLASDLSVFCGVSGSFAAFHSGARPRGSDPRTTRAVTTQQLGRAPPPQQQAQPEEPPPLEEAPLPEVLPPELAPPPVAPPEVIPETPETKRRLKQPQKPAPKPDEDDEGDVGARPTRPDPAATDSTGSSDDVSSEKTP